MIVILLILVEWHAVKPNLLSTQEDITFNGQFNTIKLFNPLAYVNG